MNEEGETKKDEAPEDKEKGEAPEDKEKGEEGKEGDNKEQEVVLIQDTGFNVTITCPGVDEFELPVGVLV